MSPNGEQKAFGHFIKTGAGLRKKIFIEKIDYISLAYHVKFTYFIGLLERTRLKFNQVPIIPIKNSDFKVWV